MVIAPLMDNKGDVHGVIQLMNKEGRDGDQITEQDKLELKALLPSLGEIIRSADDHA